MITVTYLHSDHLGSTVLTTGVAGSQRYDAYGNARSGTVPTDWQFTGQEQDGTGLVYMHARYYDPATGQFLSPDTIIPDPGSVFDYNRYMYGRGNPMKYSDPSGHCATLANGDPDREGEENYACWQAAYSIFGMGGSPHTSFADEWRISPQQWLVGIATQPFATTEYLTPFADKYSQQFRAGVGLNNGNIQWHEPPPQPLANMPGQMLLEPVAADFMDCYLDTLDCGTFLDDVALGVAGLGAAVCVGATGGACLGAVGAASTMASGVSTGITAVNVWEGNATAVDLGVGTLTTLSGALGGTTFKGATGFLLSVGQRAYDWWSGGD